MLGIRDSDGKVKARWAFMDYQVRSAQQDLAETGQAEFTGGPLIDQKVVERIRALRLLNLALECCTRNGVLDELAAGYLDPDGVNRFCDAAGNMFNAVNPSVAELIESKLVRPRAIARVTGGVLTDVRANIDIHFSLIDYDNWKEVEEDGPEDEEFTALETEYDNLPIEVF
jgi:hypothetical protein